MVMDDDLLWILKTIDRFGWAVLHIGDGCKHKECGNEWVEHPFSYSIGLTAMGHPEFLLRGWRKKDAGVTLINEFGARVQAGESFRHGQVVESRTAGAPVVFLEVIDDADMVASGQVYPEFSALQVVWPDWQGRYPWDKGYNRWKFSQQLSRPGPGRSGLQQLQIGQQ
ncbi:DUF4262 domain-containing protein [Nakamurella sp. YIM 132087]|uniref:DUF4262 domain-containing protein n=1 Tax=Nakamurella alba TaxID=2665158 RepID=A0A7K1FL67_9ACTN|nr:DUF4262 domain-containing protein [Nakamurella alba]MTD13624.1 DUF4262 domain-containing protein [Nakamurella alba]